MQKERTVKEERETRWISRRDFLRGGVVLGGAALLAACSPAAPPAPSGAPAGGAPAGGAAPSGGGAPAATSAPAASGAQAATKPPLKKVTVALGADARTLLPNAIVDQTTETQAYHIFDKVLNFDPAKGWAISPWLGELKAVDDLTWEVKVKPGVKFHNGEPLEASAIKAGIDYAKDPTNKSHYLERYKPITEMTVVNPLTLRMKTSQPFTAMPLRMTQFYPVPPKYLAEKGADFVSKNPVGTGPFKFNKWVRDERLVLDRNPDYWHNPVQVEQVEFRYIPEFSARLSALLVGEIDIVKDIPVDAIQRVNSSGTARCEETPSSRVNYVALVQNRPNSVFTNKKLRQAMNYAVNVDEIIKGVFQGHATRMAGSLSAINPEVNKNIKPYPYDPEKAKALMKEAGVDPASLNITMDAPQGRYPMDKEAAQAIAAQLAKIGVKVQVQYNEWGTHLDKIVNRKTGDMFFLGWGPAMDADGSIEFLFVKDSVYSSYGDPDIEKKIFTAVKTMDDTKRRALWDEIQQNVYDEAAWIFLWQQHDIYGVSNAVDWKPRPDEFMWMGEAKPR